MLATLPATSQLYLTLDQYGDLPLLGSNFKEILPAALSPIIKISPESTIVKGILTSSIRESNYKPINASA
jgi:hypothetical protein